MHPLQNADPRKFTSFKGQAAHIPITEEKNRKKIMQTKKMHQKKAITKQTKITTKFVN